MAVLLIILALVLVGLGIWYSYYRKAKRREALATFGLQYGLEYSREDTFGLTGYPFKLFSKGDGRGCENVLSGTWKDVQVIESDYWYYDESTDSEGHRSKSYHYFSVIMAGTGLDTPWVCIDRENLLTKIADHMGLHDIEFESEAFNKEFNVTSPDREFAFKLIDARMMHWLLGTEGGFGFEIAGPWVLVYCRRLQPMSLVPLFGSAREFVDAIPSLVRTEFGTGSPAGAEPERSSP
jgi:hypothetical protein